MKQKEIQTRSWISFRVKPKEYEKIHANFKNTTCQKLSEYARKVLLEKPVHIRYRNETSDDFLKEMIILKNELNAIGNNFNQAVKRLHTTDKDPEIRFWLTKTQPVIEQFQKKTEQIRERLNQIYQLWLSK